MFQMLENFFKSKSDDTLNSLYKYLYEFKDWRDSNPGSPHDFKSINYSSKIEKVDSIAKIIINRFLKIDKELRVAFDRLKDELSYMEGKKLSIENKEIWLEELQEKVMNQKLERDIILDIKEKELKEREADLIESWKKLEEARVLFIKSTI